MGSDNIELSVVIPIYNEELVIGQLVQRLTAALDGITNSYEIIFVNDGSKDSSLQKLKEACTGNSRLHYISFSRNFGHQVAITAGMDHARGNAIVSMDGDLQDPPELIAEMYQQYKQGYKVVYAKRQRRKGEPALKLVAAHVFYRLIAKMVSFEIPVDVGDFRLISREVLEHLKGMKEYDKYLRGQIAWLGFKNTYVMFDRDERKFGKSNYPFKKLLRLALNGITAFSDTPLKLAARLGAIVCGISFFIILYALYIYFVQQEAMPGWVTTLIGITFLGGVQLISLGIIGEYMSRITNDVRSRPLYILEETSIETQQ